MKFLAILAVVALCAGAFAQDDATQEVDTLAPEPEVETCPQTLINLYQVSRNVCIDEIRANRTASRAQDTNGTTTEEPASANDDIEEEIENCAEDELEEEDDAENVEDNRSRRNSDPRPRRSRGRRVRWSRRRKQFFRQFKSCLVNKIKDNSIVAQLKTICVANCSSVNVAKRETKEQKCVLKKLKQRCPDIVPARRVRTHRRNRHNNISNRRD